jgi:hypothetical protein
MAGAVEDFDCVRENVGDYLERFDGAARAAGKIQDERACAAGALAAREDRMGIRARSGGAHALTETGDQTFGGTHGGFGSDIAGAEARATCRQDQVKIAGIGEIDEASGDLAGVVWEDGARGNGPAEFYAVVGDGLAGAVFSLAAEDGVADGENGYAHLVFLPRAAVKALALLRMEPCAP